MLSCTEDSSEVLSENSFSQNDEEQEKPFEGNVTIKNGHLSFPSQESFTNYMKKLKEENTVEEKRERMFKAKNAGFYSLAERASSLKRRSLKDFSEKRVQTQEQAEDEFAEQIIESLIPEEEFRSVLDTNFTVEVAGQVYKINELGTFAFKSSHKKEFEKIYSTFSKNKNQYRQIEPGVYQCSENVKFSDTFGVMEGKSILDGVVEGDSTEVRKNNFKIARKFRSSDRNTREYGLVTFSMAGHGFFKRNHRHTRGFGSEKRLEVKAYEKNYLVYSSSGIKIQFKRKKQKWLRIKIFGWRMKTKLYTYWVEAPADRLVVGVENFKGYTEYEDFGLSYDYANTEVSFANNFNHIASEMIFKALKFDPIIRGLGGKVNIFKHQMRYNGKMFFLGQKLKDLAEDKISDLVYDQLRRFTKKGVFGLAGIDLNIERKDPKLMYHNAIAEYNKEYVYFSGFKNYTNKSSIKLRFGRSVSVGFPKAPNRFHLTEISIFGAAYCNGAWRGVRIVR